MKKIELSIFIGMLFAIISGSYSSFAANVQEMRDNVLRLHIIANSDREEDQILKIKVRDRILTETGSLFYNTGNLYEAQTAAAQNLEKIIEAAQDEIYNNGFAYKADAEIVEMFFEATNYDGITLPAGNYNAVRIILGESKGKNWWCVLYPPLCIPAAQEKVNNEILSEVFDEEQLRIVEKPQEYEIRFAVLDFFENIKNSLF